jgi:hypothetical protein
MDLVDRSRRLPRERRTPRPSLIAPAGLPDFSSQCRNPVNLPESPLRLKASRLGRMIFMPEQYQREPRRPAQRTSCRVILRRGGRAESPDLKHCSDQTAICQGRTDRRILAHWAGPAPVTECDPISGPACCLPAMRAAGGVDPWLPPPVLAVLVRVLDQRQGRHLLVLEQVRRLDLNGFGLAPCGKDHRFVLEHLLIDVEGCA